jgi:hypothetical protein
LLATVSFYRLAEVVLTHGDSIVASEIARVSVKDDFVFARHWDSESIIDKALVWMEVEDPEEASSFKGDHFVTFVLEIDISLEEESV